MRMDWNKFPDRQLSKTENWVLKSAMLVVIVVAAVAITAKVLSLYS